MRLRKARVAIAAAVALPLVAGAFFAVRLASFRRDVALSDEAWKTDRPGLLAGVGTTRSLTILPLLDFHAARADLKTEVGVAYLVKTDDATILFDVGNDSAGASPSPLEQNMKALGVSIDNVDTVVLSHAHFDHVGGRRWTNGSLSGTTFGFGAAQPSLKGKRIVAPIAMTYPGATPEIATHPVRIATGVATTGTIRRRLFAEWVEEQALAVHVEGRGIVLIVGCGHQTVPRLLQRTRAVFPHPIAGILGGLHYPVPEGRLHLAGLDLQRLFGSGDGPLAPLTEANVDAELALLKNENLSLIAVGGHDSSDAVVERVKERFGSAHRYLRVGEPIVVAP